MLKASRFSLLFLLVTSTTIGGEVPSDTKLLADVRGYLREAGKAYREQSFDRCVDLLIKAREGLGALPANSAAQAAAKSLRDSLTKATQRLLKQGDFPRLRGKQTPTVSFSLQIADVLSQRCLGCHGPDRARKGLRMDTFAELAKGSRNGLVLRAGDENSLIMAKLKGTADGDRMPPSGTPLTDEQIQTIRAWIVEGAVFDGSDPTMHLQRVAALKRQSTLPADELNAAARQAAVRNWVLAFPDSQPLVTETKNFLFFAKGATVDLDGVSASMEQSLKDVTRLLGSRQVKIDALIPTYLFPRNYDFSEFSRMVANGSHGKQTEGYWHDNDGLGFLVIGPTALTETSLEVDRLIASFLLRRWGAPPWYADGMGRTVYAKQHRRDPRVRNAASQATRVVTTIKSAKQLLEDELPENSVGLANWAFVQYLNQDTRRVERLHGLLRADKAFDTSFQACFGGSPEAVCKIWLGKRTGRRQR